ncbi:MAG: SAM-dependent methyltransferase [Clostridia bacterium]|nr:SAM-dependent methyltransferase [Clostridia bacterium]
MFGLDERLSLCASLVRSGVSVADIGTDHAYLPVWLALNGRIKSALACDVRIGPLDNAKSNIEKNGVGNIVKTVLSDGLDEIVSDDADDIIMAGMGGELIVKLIDRTEWLKCGDKNLILQPMTRAEVLRRYLCENGFAVKEEKACISLGKSYSVMLCSYDGIRRECSDEYSYIGELAKDGSYESKRYIYVINEKLKKKLRGCKEGTEDYTSLLQLIEKFDGYSRGVSEK